MYVSLDRIIVLAPSIPGFKGLDMRNLQYWITYVEFAKKVIIKSQITITIYLWLEF